MTSQRNVAIVALQLPTIGIYGGRVNGCSWNQALCAGKPVPVCVPGLVA
jgi:hypothetical protein